MRARRRIVAAIALIGIVILFARSVITQSGRSDASATASRKSEMHGDGQSPPSTPRYVSVRLNPSGSPLVAGEAGTLELDIRLKDDTRAAGMGWSHDRDGVPPTAWVSSPQGSGIAFVYKRAPKKPGQQVLVRFTIPEEPDINLLAASVEYTVNARTKAGEHHFWVDVSVPLVTRDGRKIQDMGVVSVPFEVDTHLTTKLLMLLVIAAVVCLFIVEWVRVDVVGILMMVLLPALGLLDAQHAFRGLSSNAVVAIIGVMIISYGLNRAGLVGVMIHLLLESVGKTVRGLTTIFSGLIAVISSVMQNTGAAVLFLPAIRQVAKHELRVPVARMLMPIGMAAILGGTLTMIGTSPLILLNDILPSDVRRFGLLDLTPIGLALVVGGIVYLSTVGMRTLGKIVERRAAEADGLFPETHLADAYPEVNGPYEIFVPTDYKPGKGRQDVADIHKAFGVNIVAISGKGGVQYIAPAPHAIIPAGSGLCVYGPEKAVREFAREYGLTLRRRPKLFKRNLSNAAVASTVELVILPRSTLIGRTIDEIRFRETFEVSVLALHQSGKTYYRDMGQRTLQPGDGLLVHGTWKQFHSLQERRHDFIVVITMLESELQKPESAKRALACFLGALALMMVSSFHFQYQPYNPIPLSICLMAGAVGMVLTRVMTISEAYRAVDWRTVFLLGGLISLGVAVNQTGTAHWIASGIVAGLGEAMSPLLLLIVLACLSCGLTMVISNVGACALLVPLGISLANQIGVEPRVAAIVVGLGVSNSFILPTHQVNALYMGPGEYRTRDYVRIGGGLSLIYIVILVTMTYFFYM